MKGYTILIKYKGFVDGKQTKEIYVKGKSSSEAMAVALVRYGLYDIVELSVVHEYDVNDPE